MQIHAITVERAQQICRNFLRNRAICRHNNDKNAKKHVHNNIYDYARIRDLIDNRSDRELFP